MRPPIVPSSGTLTRATNTGLSTHVGLTSALSRSSPTISAPYHHLRLSRRSLNSRNQGPLIPRRTGLSSSHSSESRSSSSRRSHSTFSSGSSPLTPLIQEPLCHSNLHHSRSSVSQRSFSLSFHTIAQTFSNAFPFTTAATSSVSTPPPASSSPSSSTSTSQPPPPPPPRPTSTIKTLMRSPSLFSPLFKPPKHLIVLCHGLYGYGVRGKPGAQIHYWAHVHDVLVACGAEVLVVEVPSKGSIVERARVLHETLESQLSPGQAINFLAHSMGGLDCRHLITHIRPTSYVVKSLTCVATPHRGSPFMDWCKATIGLGTPLESLAEVVDPGTPKFIPAWSLPVPLLSPMAPTTPPPSPPPSPSPRSSTSESRSSTSSSPLKSQSKAQIDSLVDHAMSRGGPSPLSSPSSSTSTASQEAPMSSSSSSTSTSSSSSPCDQPGSSTATTTTTTSSYFTPLFQSFSLLRDRLLQLCDSPAYYNLTTSYLNDTFNPSTPDVPSVAYYSIAARANSIPPIHPLFYTKVILDHTAMSGQAERDGWAGERYEGNDGMVSVSSAKWGEFLGIVDDCHHWDLRGKEGKLKASIATSPSTTHPSPVTDPTSAATTTTSSSSSSTTTSPSTSSSPPTSTPSSPAAAVSPSIIPWPLPDINASITSYIENTTKQILPSRSSNNPSSPTTASKTSTTTDHPSHTSTIAPSPPPSSSTIPVSHLGPHPSQPPTSLAEAQAESESRFSSALNVMSSYLPPLSPVPFSLKTWFAPSSSSSSSSPASSSSSSLEREGEEKGQEGSGNVDQGLRERTEGKKEKFEVDRFYRAIVLNLSNRGF